MSLNSKIMIVDDDKTMLELLNIYLKAEGFTVFSCADSVEALRMIPEISPDLIILDLVMPVIDGVKLLRWIREDMNLKTPVIICSASVPENIMSMILFKEITQVIEKPFNPEELLTLVRTFIQP